MVKGLDIFREHFRPFVNQYMLIGGSACDLIMTDAGLEFRATKDLDIVLCTDPLESSFIEAFWQFIRLGGFRAGGQGQQRQYYRFSHPAVDEYPALIELFARQPGALPVREGAHLTPIPAESDASSLSAILLDGPYYEFLKSGRTLVNGVPIAGPAHLIGLKAKAWLDLSAKRLAGETVDARNITKHKNDVFRLYRVLDPDIRVMAPGGVQSDLATFLERVAAEGVDVRALGVTGSMEAAMGRIRRIFGLDLSASGPD